MDIFKGNQKLEEELFTTLDYAIYSRSDLESMFTPFMRLTKNGKTKLVRSVYEGNPIEGFKKILKEEKEIYDQIVYALEGRIAFQGEKYDAIFVTAFDTSHEKGITFVQRFRGKETGKGFERLGNSALLSQEEELPVQRVERETGKDVEAPSISATLEKKSAEEFFVRIKAGHTNASTLSNLLFDTVLNILDRNDKAFNGVFKIHIDPNLITQGGFTSFIFNQLIVDLKNNSVVLDWERSFNKTINIELIYNDGEDTVKNEPVKNEKTASPNSCNNDKPKEKKPWWKFGES